VAPNPLSGLGLGFGAPAAPNRNPSVAAPKGPLPMHARGNAAVEQQPAKKDPFADLLG
jgi:hypothetical protein